MKEISCVIAAPSACFATVQDFLLIVQRSRVALENVHAGTFPAGVGACVSLALLAHTHQKKAGRLVWSVLVAPTRPRGHRSVNCAIPLVLVFPGELLTVPLQAVAVVLWNWR